MRITTDTLSVTAAGTLPRVPFARIKDKVLGKRYELSIAFVPPALAQRLNQTHRQKDYIPNTLSFSLSKSSGEIILCKSALRSQYKKFDMDYDTYVTFIIIHSMLHLKGFVHGGTMEDKERTLLHHFTTHGKTTHHRRH